MLYKLILIGVVVVLSGCTFVVGINGVPYQVSIEGVPGILTPTEEQFPTSIYTPMPTTTATALPTVTPFVCSLTADSNINMRDKPGGTFLFLINKGDVRIPDAYTTYGGLKYYRFELPVDSQNPYAVGWAADFFSENGNCGGLPLVSPF